MKHPGQILKKQIEDNHLVKKDVAAAVGITYNYLSTIFKRDDIDCSLWEKLCMATGLNPAVVFDTPCFGNKSYSDIQANTVVGPATVMIGEGEHQALLDLLAEKERMIQILLAASNLKIGTELGQKN